MDHDIENADAADKIADKLDLERVRVLKPSVGQVFTYTARQPLTREHHVLIRAAWEKAWRLADSEAPPLLILDAGDQLAILAKPDPVADELGKAAA